MKKKIRYRQIFEAACDPIMLLNSDGFFDCNAAALQMFKISSPEQLQKLAPWDLSPENQPDGTPSKTVALARMDEAFERGQAKFDWLHLDTEGNEFPAEVTLSCFDLEGRQTLQVMIKDISERKAVKDKLLKTNKQLKESNRQLKSIERKLRAEVEEKQRAEFFLKSIIDTVPDPIFVKDSSHRWIELNEAFCEFMGESRQELLGKSDYDFFPKEEADVFWEKDSLVFQTGEENLNEEYFTDASGKRHIISTKKSCFILPETGEKVLVGVIRDMTERKATERALEKAKNYSENIIRNFLDTLILTDSRGVIQKISEATLEMLDYREEELVGQAVSKIFSREDKQRVERFFTGRLEVLQETGNVRNLALHYRKRNGDLIPMSFNGATLADEAGEFNGVVAGAKEISGLINAQRELKKQLREKETLLKEVHHRVKNNLFMMISFLEMQLISVEDEKTSDVLEEAINRLQTMALVHKHIYSKEELSDIEFSDFLKELVAEVISTLKNPAIDINCSFELDRVSLPLDLMIPCGMVVNELLTNAVRHGFKYQKKGNIKLTFEAGSKFYQLIIADDGRGLPKNFVLERLDPTAFGLNLVKTMVEKQFDGEFHYSSGEWTKFKIKFPVPAST